MGSESDGIQPGFISRNLIILLVKVRHQKHVKRLWKPSSRPISAFNICIKVKPFASLAEVDAMRFVERNTSIPVPKVHYAFDHKGHTYIMMSKIRGTMASQGWHDRTEQSRAEILGQLSRIISELRSVPCPPGKGVGGVEGGPFFDCRLPTKLLWGPFDTVRDFHEALADCPGLDKEYQGLPSDVAELFDFYRNTDNKLVLTHGDLSSLNILVDGDTVTGIIDWEMAGWFPPYWEYVNAKNANPQNAFWADEVDKFLDPMAYELEMDWIRRNRFGAF